MTTPTDAAGRIAQLLHVQREELAQWSENEQREAGDLLEQLLAERERLRAYVQHKPECALWVTSTPNGEIRFLVPRMADTVRGYENSGRICTCRLTPPRGADQ